MDRDEFEEYFYSLVRPKRERKLVKCLKCTKPFVSKNYSANRICAICSGAIAKYRNELNRA